ncbi:hypothetical protein Agub_g9219, partial [Astrephomene gubernaculifera]
IFKVVVGRGQMAVANSALAVNLLLKGQDLEAWETLRSCGGWTSQLAAAAPSTGHAVWSEAMRARASRLARGGHLHWAACHLLAVGDVWQAVQLYMCHGLHREALSLARCRLAQQDPAFARLLGQMLASGQRPGSQPRQRQQGEQQRQGEEQKQVEEQKQGAEQRHVEKQQQGEEQETGHKQGGAKQQGQGQGHQEEEQQGQQQGQEGPQQEHEPQHRH